MNKWLKMIGAAVVVGALAVTALSAVASAQSPTPTTPTTPSTQPNQQPGWGMFGWGHGMRGMGQGMFGGMGPGMHDERGFGGIGQNSLITAFAKALGTTESDVLTQLQAGKTLAELAQAKSVNTATVISDYLKTFQESLTTAVTNKQLTQAQADAMLALKKANAEAALTYKYDPSTAPQPGAGGLGGMHGGMRGGHGWWGIPNQQQQQQAPSGTQQSN